MNKLFSVIERLTLYPKWRNVLWNIHSLSHWFDYCCTGKSFMGFEVSQILEISKHVCFPIIQLWGTIKKVSSFFESAGFFSR